MQLRFAPSESTTSYFEALQWYVQTHGCPVAFYSDKLWNTSREQARNVRQNQFSFAPTLAVGAR